MALCRAVLINHARGFAGVPSEGQFCNATAYASCNISSARSKSPRRRMSVERMRPDSSRWSFSRSMRVRIISPCGKGIVNFRDTAETGCATEYQPAHFLALDGLASGHDGAHFDVAVTRARYAGADGEGLVEVGGFDQLLANQLLLGCWKA